MLEDFKVLIMNHLILGVDGSDTKFELGDDQGNNFLRFSKAGNGSIDISTNFYFSRK